MRTKTAAVPGRNLRIQQIATFANSTNPKLWKKFLQFEFVENLKLQKTFAEILKKFCKDFGNVEIEILQMFSAN